MTKPKSIPWKKPCLRVGTLSSLEGLKLLNKKQPLADLIEVRYDILRQNGVDTDTLRSYLQKRQNPVLLTLRTMREGGSYPWKSRERVLLFLELLPDVDAIDVELQNIPLVREVLSAARRSDRGIVLSAHSISRKLTLGRGERWVEQFRHYRADVYKLAALARTRKDLGVLARLVLDHPELRIGAMALGPMAALSRQVLPVLGSRLVYGYLDQPVSKGQPSLEEIAPLVPEKIK